MCVCVDNHNIICTQARSSRPTLSMKRLRSSRPTSSFTTTRSRYTARVWLYAHVYSVCTAGCAHEYVCACCVCTFHMFAARNNCAYSCSFSLVVADAVCLFVHTGSRRQITFVLDTLPVTMPEPLDTGVSPALHIHGVPCVLDTCVLLQCCVSACTHTLTTPTAQLQCTSKDACLKEMYQLSIETFKVSARINMCALLIYMCACVFPETLLACTYLTQ